MLPSSTTFLISVVTHLTLGRIDARDLIFYPVTSNLDGQCYSSVFPAEGVVENNGWLVGGPPFIPLYKDKS